LKNEKKHFYIKFAVGGQIFERYAWYVSLASFKKALAKEFEKKYPRIPIFLNVIEEKEIKHPERRRPLS
jgi:hypothetical protein